MSIVLPGVAAESAIVARFKMVIRCHNCWRIFAGTLAVPEAVDAPADTDELLDSGLLRRVRFECDHCESAICELVGVSLVYDEAEAA